MNDAGTGVGFTIVFDEDSVADVVGEAEGSFWLGVIAMLERSWPRYGLWGR
jgi:hypothetical protein